MANEFYTRSLAVSFVLHATVAGGFLLFALLQGCAYRRHKAEMIEFTVAVDTGDLDEPEQPAVKPPERPPDPVKPPDLPPAPDDVPAPPPKIAKPAVKPPVKPPEKPPKVKPPIQKGRRIKAPPQNKPVKQTLSDKEIREWLGRRARIGTVDSLPSSEQAMNFALVRNALYDAWEQPPRAEAGPRPAEVEFSLDSAGRLSGPRIVQSSGSAVFDASTLEAVRAAGRIPGLSARFLREYPKLSVEFRIEP
jgi:TonB family protein